MIAAPRLTALFGIVVAATVVVSGCAATDPVEPAAESRLATVARVLAKCMTDKGWEVTIMPDNSVNSRYSDDQKSAHDQAEQDCESEYDLNALPEVTDDYLHDIYPQVVATAECLTREGHDPGEPPSEQKFIDDVRAQVGWDPYGQIDVPGAMAQDQYYALIQKCPRTWE